MSTKQISDATFEQDVLKSDKMIAPSLEEISDERDDIVIAKINIDENPETPSKFGVRGIPTMILFRDGAQAATKVGALPKQQIASWIDDCLL